MYIPKDENHGKSEWAEALFYGYLIKLVWLFNQIFYLKSNLGLSNPSSFDGQNFSLNFLNLYYVFILKY